MTSEQHKKRLAANVTAMRDEDSPIGEDEAAESVQVEMFDGEAA